MITRRICNRLQIRRVIFLNNPVGYNNSEFTDDGQQFKAASFITIGEKDAEGNNCVRLSDLNVTGYMDTMGGCWNGVYITMLKKDGANLKINDPTYGEMDVTYFWNEEEGGMEPGWYDSFGNMMKDDASPLGNADEITFANGEGIGITCDLDYIGCKLVSNGEVVQGAVDYTFVDDGQQIVGNPLARAITLSEITCDGYMDTMGGCWNGIYITVLKKDGANLKINDPTYGEMDVTYFWNEEEGGMEAGWYDSFGNPLKGDASPLGNADEIIFASGEGIGITCDLDYVGCQLHFPSLGLKQ